MKDFVQILANNMLELIKTEEEGRDVTYKEVVTEIKEAFAEQEGGVVLKSIAAWYKLRTGEEVDTSLE